jgi:replicative DNA helicase
VQIISAQKKFVDNRQRIDYISQALKKCAKETKCSFVVLSQITRAGKDAPSMSDLKESGGLEQDSDYIILLHRPYVNDKESGKARPSETKIILDKNKFGNTGVINYNFNGMFQRFTELEEDDTQRISKPINTVTSADDLPF